MRAGFADIRQLNNRAWGLLLGITWFGICLSFFWSARVRNAWVVAMLAIFSMGLLYSLSAFTESAWLPFHLFNLPGTLTGEIRLLQARGPFRTLLALCGAGVLGLSWRRFVRR